MRRLIVPVFVSGLLILGMSCGLEKPDNPDGRNTLTILALDTSGVNGEGWVPVAGASVEVGCTTAEYRHTFETDADGRLVIEHLPAGRYNVQASKKDEVSKVLFIGQAVEGLMGATEQVDTIFMSFMPTSPIVINEVYFAGCNASSFYYYDQYIELYNTTDETFYLDGYSLVRSTQVSAFLDYDIETADYALGYYVYVFPGTRSVTHQCPIGPKEYLVVACDATNHHNYGALCVDLSHADWEFFCAQGNDYDNPSVPNLTPISTEGNDFSMNLAHCAVWLATTEEYTFKEHCYINSSGGITCTTYIETPLSTILDAVEFSSNLSSPRYITTRLDAGYGGVGIVRYGGKSIERKVPGLDSNNSAFDFEIVTPTPGYGHVR
jgi:hypothetical protein